MVSDLHEQEQLEHFLRNASAEELIQRRSLIQSMPAQTPAAFEDTERLVARIAYELRFRVPQPI
jgi:hypothetical protein